MKKTIRNLAVSMFMVAVAAMLAPGQDALAAFCEPWTPFTCTDQISNQECECWTNCLGQYWGICENSNACVEAHGAAEDVCALWDEIVVQFVCDDPLDPPVEFEFRCEDPFPY